MLKSLSVFLMFLFLLNACESKSSYKNELEKYYQTRNADLKTPRGYLRLVGLFWLDDGATYTLGSGAEAQIRIPDSTLAPIAGTISRTGDAVTFYSSPNSALLLDEKPLQSPHIVFFDKDRSPILSINTFEWFVIKRGSYIGIRLFDTNHKKANDFTGAERFEADKKWLVKAKLVKKETSNKILIPDVLGQINEYESPGFLEFELEGKTFSLQTQVYDNEYFIVFGDVTNKKETYQGGRFLYVPLVDKSGYTFIDLNKSLNPPCMYSDFTTCPLPPEQNKLPIEIKAGEKRWKKEIN